MSRFSIIGLFLMTRFGPYHSIFVRRDCVRKSGSVESVLNCERVFHQAFLSSIISYFSASKRALVRGSQKIIQPRFFSNIIISPGSCERTPVKEYISDGLRMRSISPSILRHNNKKSLSHYLQSHAKSNTIHLLTYFLSIL